MKGEVKTIGCREGDKAYININAPQKISNCVCNIEEMATNIPHSHDMLIENCLVTTLNKKNFR